ncbi:MAG TPA: type IV pilus modification protein PilV [Gammaproteobacteria bacterium]|nr:type IV pilus modification protein PilV [Gammaproteobacteria bacterium]
MKTKRNMVTQARLPLIEDGFSLIEAMIALVVLSVGMMGIAAMYAEGLGAGRTAVLRTQAVNLAADMADRIRVNRLGGSAYEGAAANNMCDPQSGGDDDTMCTPAQMAAHDLFVWEDQIAGLLPGGEGSVDYDDSTLPPTYTIEVDWEEPGVGALSYQVAVQVPDF